MMARVAGRCRAMRAQILEHAYHYNAFGSWWLSLDFRGRLYRIALDARGSELTLERAADPRRPEFVAVAARRLGGAELELMVDGLLDALAAGNV
jgi:hypothetical protein